MARVYLASSWRNEFHGDTLTRLRGWGHEVYNFRGAETYAEVPKSSVFKWEEIDPNWQGWSPRKYRELLLNSHRAAHGYVSDFRAMEWADICILLMPCGRSAHIEAGYMKGRSKRLIIHFPNENPPQFEPDLMYLLADHITIGPSELQWAVNEPLSGRQANAKAVGPYPYYQDAERVKSGDEG